jgi:hypothetical protein
MPQDITFVREDWRLFLNLSTLGQKAGVSRSMIGALVVKEIVDNALDAGANVECGHLEDGWIFVQDDGPGLDPERIAQLFSVNRPLTSTKLLRRPLRGALGNGLRVVAGAVYASGGGLRVRTRGKWIDVYPQPNGASSTKIDDDHDRASGLRVEIKLGGDVSASLAMANLSLVMNKGGAYKGLSSPLWYDVHAFRELLHAARGARLSEVLALVDGGKRFMEMFGKTVSDTSKNPDPLCADLDMGAVEAIHGGLCSIVKDVPPKALGQVGRDGGPYEGYAKVAGTFRSADTSPVSLPCVVEVWAEKSDDSEPFVHMMVNRTLVPAQMKTWLDRKAGKMVLQGCGLSHYVPTGRTVFKACCNIITPYMPITNDGKEPDLLPLLDLISDAFKKAAASARRASPAEAQGSSKRDLIECCIDGAIAKASGGGVYRYSLRQLYYAVRPRLLDYGMELEYGYFCSVVTAIEARRGHDLPGMYRDARGHLYHPHTGETIALGTLNVEKYEQPEYLFNKVLYVEKGGFFPLLIEQKWPERHDCALLTSQGFASRAARDVIDLLGDGDEEITFYAIHDADGPGTAIIEALQEATRARPGRRVKIVNLGLEPAEGMAMKLEVEKVESKAKSIPVGSYVSPRWREWLQDHRIELNAMDSETFVQWLDRKMSQATSDHDTPRKLIPPAAVVDAAIEEQRRRLARQRAVEKVLAAVDIDSLAAQELAEAGRAPSADRVRSELAADPSASWRQISDSLAEKSLA